MANLALNKSATASSYILPYVPGRAVDGNLSPTNRWLCNTLPGSMMVDLGATYWINRWVVKHMGSISGWQSPDYNMSDYSFQGSNDKSNWTTLDTISGNTAHVTDRSFTPIPFRYVRLYVTKGLLANPQLASCMELEVYEAPHSSALLSALTISDGTLTPSFMSTEPLYSATVSVASIKLTPIAEDSNATIKVNGTVVANGQATAALPLSLGNNVIIITVTGAIGGDVVKYTLNITRENNLYLANVDLNYSGLGYKSTSTITMDHSTLNYSNATFRKAVKVVVIPNAEDTAVSINVNGQSLSSGSSSAQIAISATSNQIPITVTYPGDSSSRKYVVTITKS